MSRVPEPIRCQEVRERLDDWLDDELESGERTRLERHLRDCPGCRAAAQRATELVAALRALPERDAPGRVRAAAIEAASRRRWRVPLPWAGHGLSPLPLVAVTTALVVALLGSVWLFGPLLDARPAPVEVARATEDARRALLILGRIGERTARELREEQLERRVLVPLVRGLGRASELSEPALEEPAASNSRSIAGRTEEPR